MPVTPTGHSDTLLGSYSIGLKLKALRREKGLSLARLGAEVGLSTALLSKLESERMIPTLPTLAKISHAYGVDLSFFFSDVQHHSSALTRRAHMLDDRREQSIVKTTPLHLPRAESKQVSKLIDLPGGATVTLSEPAKRAEFTAHVLEGNLRVNSAGSEERLSAGDCKVFDTDAAVLFTAEEPRCRVLAVVAR